MEVILPHSVYNESSVLFCHRNGQSYSGLAASTTDDGIGLNCKLAQLGLGKEAMLRPEHVRIRLGF